MSTTSDGWDGRGRRGPDSRRIRGRVRSAARGVRGGRPPTDGVGAGSRATGDRVSDPDINPAVLALVAEPFVSVEDAHTRLRALEETFREAGDRRGSFLAVYAQVTGAVGRAIEAGAFADPEWAADYLVAFAELYRRALSAYERGDLSAVPDAWQVAFETAERGDCLVAQDVALGINAHVNYDLALALCDVGVDPHATRYADHCAINDVLQGLVDEVQELLARQYAPGIATFDESLGRLDEAFGFYALREGRDSAWRSAVALSSRFGPRRRLARWVLRTTSTGTAYLVRSPNLGGSLYEDLRRVEREAPGSGVLGADEW